MRYENNITAHGHNKSRAMEPNIYRTISDNNRENLSRVPGWFCFDFTLHGLRGLNTAKSISKALYGLSYLAGGARLLGVVSVPVRGG